MWGDHPKGIVESEEEDGLWGMLLDGYGGSAEDDEADEWADTHIDEPAEAGIIASPIVPLDESTPEELCRCASGIQLPLFKLVLRTTTRRQVLQQQHKHRDHGFSSRPLPAEVASNSSSAVVFQAW